jgi:hypothetical protein
MNNSKEYEDFAMRNLINLVDIQKEFIKDLWHWDHELLFLK